MRHIYIVLALLVLGCSKTYVPNIANELSSKEGKILLSLLETYADWEGVAGYGIKHKKYNIIIRTPIKKRIDEVWVRSSDTLVVEIDGNECNEIFYGKERHKIWRKAADIIDDIDKDSRWERNEKARQYIKDNIE